MNISRLLPPLSLLIVSCLLSPVSQLFAVEVEPLRVEQTLSLNQPAQAELKVSNPLDHSVGVRMSAGPYRLSQPELKISSAEDWIRFEPARFVLAPGASTTVRVRLEPPAAVANDTAAEYLAAIVIDQLPATDPSAGRPGEEPEKPQGSRISIVPRLAIPVYLQVQGRERVEVELADVSVQATQGLASSESGESAPELLRIDTSLRNRGTVHVRLSGTFALFDQNGKLVRSGPLGRTLPVLASSTLVLPTLFPLPPPGHYQLALTVENGPDALLQKEVSFEITGDGRIVRDRK